VALKFIMCAALAFTSIGIFGVLSRVASTLAMRRRFPS
jgi:hypothetical protein